MNKTRIAHNVAIVGLPLAVCVLLAVLLWLLPIDSTYATDLPAFGGEHTSPLALDTPVYLTSTVLLEDVGGAVVELAPAFGGYLQYFTIMQEGDMYYMWLNSNKRSLPRFGVEQRFQSQDGLVWSDRTNTNLALPGGDDYEYVAGIRSIIKEAATYEAWESYYYEHSQGWAYAMRYVTSSDGLDWQVIAQPTLIGTLSQNVMKQNGLYRMWARVDVDGEMYPNVPEDLRYRTSDTGGSGWGNWQTGGEQIWLNGAATDRGISRVRQLPDSTYELFYFHPDTGRIDLAVSTDGLSFQTLVIGLVDFDLVLPGWQIVMDFDVVPVGAEDWIYFTYKANDSFHIGVTRPAYDAPVFIDDADYSVQYGGFAGFGGWVGTADANAYGGGYRAANSLGKTMTYKTPAPTDAVAFITYRGPDQGKAYVFIDGQFRDLLNLYFPQPTYQLTLEYGNLNPLQSHTIMIVASGLKSPYSNGRDVRVDGFAFGNAITDDNELAVQYNLWNGTAVPGAFGGGFRQTVAPDATINFAAWGAEFSWLTLRCPMCGEADVIVDGQFLATVDTYYPIPQLQYEVQMSGLEPGPHAVTIRTLGTHNPNAANSLIVFDGYAP